jgi:dUTP pyrophosphatase
MKLNVMLDDGAFMPEKAHDADAGFDLRTPVDFWMGQGSEILIDTGVHVEIPKGYVGFLKSKSGLNVNYGITSDGVIDSGYTGSIKAKLYRSAAPRKEKAFEAGDKITQLVILPIPDIEMVLVDEFHETERGNNGFGSSGR